MSRINGIHVQDVRPAMVYASTENDSVIYPFQLHIDGVIIFLHADSQSEATLTELSAAIDSLQIAIAERRVKESRDNERGYNPSAPSRPLPTTQP